MKTFHQSLITIHLLAFFSAFPLFSFSAFGQGSLTPPGPPGMTMKALDQIASTGIAINPTNTPPNGNYLYVIGNPGSYYLTGNVAVVSTGSAIHVTAAGVTIEMNGFQIAGPPSSGDGIDIDATAHRCTVKNGSITGFAYGVQCLNSNGYARGGSFLQLAVSGCSNTGLQAGDAWQVDGCKAHDNMGHGISAGDNSTLTNCAASKNTGVGISTGSGNTLTNCAAAKNTVHGIGASNSTLTNCSANFNPGSGINAISSTLTNCCATSNTGIGIYVSDSTLTNCSAQYNAGSGIYATQLFTVNTLTNCVAANNSGQYGIFADNGSTLSNCAASGNSSSESSSYGIHAGTHCAVIDCTANGNINSNNTPGSNTGVGIFADTGSTIKGCTVSGNKGDGIQFASWCLISGNNSTSNGARGFATVGSGGNRIDGNQAISNTGFGFLTSTDVVIRNTAFANGGAQYSPATGTYIGPLGTPNTATSPWANF